MHLIIAGGGGGLLTLLGRGFIKWNKRWNLLKNWKWLPPDNTIGETKISEESKKVGGGGAEDSDW